MTAGAGRGQIGSGSSCAVIQDAGAGVEVFQVDADAVTVGLVIGLIMTDAACVVVDSISCILNVVGNLGAVEITTGTDNLAPVGGLDRLVTDVAGGNITVDAAVDMNSLAHKGSISIDIQMTGMTGVESDRSQAIVITGCWRESVAGAAFGSTWRTGKIAGTSPGWCSIAPFSRCNKTGTVTVSGACATSCSVTCADTVSTS